MAVGSLNKARELTLSEYVQNVDGEWCFENIRKDARVIIYGAGYYGKKIVQYIGEKGLYQIVAWVDQSYEEIKNDVRNPEDIPSLQYDVIIISIINEKVADDVKGYLVNKLGVDENAIRWPFWNKKRLSDLYEKEYRHTATVKWEDNHTEVELDCPYVVTSMICNQDFIDMPFSQYWAKRISGGTPYYHRKLWELTYISQGLFERGMLVEGKKGLSFGTGEECLPDLFASMGCYITATDLNPAELDAKGWIETGQNAAGDKSKLRKRHFCNDKTFDERVTMSYVNMNEIPKEYNEQFDFCWSACALEHIGGIEQGLEFIRNSLKTLKKGGVAIHTTEYNLFSNEATIDEKGLCLFRKKDIEGLIQALSQEGYSVSPMDWYVGNNVVDNFIDIPPKTEKPMHLRLLIERFPCTSIGIVIRK